jgi:hypothetical protein
MVVMTNVSAVGTAFRLEGGLHLYKVRAEAMQHVLDHMVRSDTKSFLSNFSR